MQWYTMKVWIGIPFSKRWFLAKTTFGKKKRFLPRRFETLNTGSRQDLRIQYVYATISLFELTKGRNVFILFIFSCC